MWFFSDEKFKMMSWSYKCFHKYYSDSILTSGKTMQCFTKKISVHTQYSEIIASEQKNFPRTKLHLYMK